MQNKIKVMKTLIWPWPIRLFHWSLVLMTAGAWIFSEFEEALPLHVALGYGVGALLIFRWIWGIVGPRYSRFWDWPLSIDALKKFVKDFRNPLPYPGHNPAASWVMLGILLIGSLVVLSGVVVYGVQEGRGPLSSLNEIFSPEMEFFEDAHEVFVTLWGVLIAAHLSGVAVDRILHPGPRTLRSMVDGYKLLDVPSASLTKIQSGIALLLLSFSILTPIASLRESSILTESRYAERDYEAEHELFVSECASCHILYPPHLLPKASWKRMMSTLSDHFGDDASLDEKERKEIESYLLANAANTSPKEAAVYLRRSIEANASNVIIAPSQTKYWKKRHAKIDPKLFEREEVRSRSNCKACHGDIEKGMIEDRNIRLPERTRE